MKPKARPVAARPVAAQPPVRRPAAKAATARPAAARPKASAKPAKPRSAAALAAARRKMVIAERGETYRQTLIPILMTCAVLLIVLATCGLASIPDDPPDTDDVNSTNMDLSDYSMLNKPWAKTVILMAYPMAAVLALGAWLFIAKSQRYKVAMAAMKEGQAE